MADAAEAGLQRSEISFRRQGSSGLVWDDKFLSGEFNLNRHSQEQPKTEETVYKSKAVAGGELNLRRSKSDNGRHATYRTLKVEPAEEDPPSPKVSGCGFCALLGKTASPATAVAKQRKHGKRRNTIKITRA
ncbi:hypothetical protein Dimus_023524 [Dionaea muscipula]